MILLKKLVVIFFSTIVFGCSTYYPLPLDEKNIEERLKNGDFKNGLPLSKTEDEAINNMKTYADWYLIKAENLRKTQYKFSDTSLGFRILGLAAGIAGESDLAATSTITSSIVGWPNERYKVDIQASNYEKAADAMMCMYKQITPFQTGDARKALPKQNILDDKIYEVRVKLRKLQTSSIVLATPDLAKIESAMKTLISPSIASSTVNGERNLLTADENKNWEDERNKLEASLDKCIGEFSI